MAETHDRRREKLIEGSTLGAGVVLALAFFAMVNYLGMRHYQRFDWTGSRLYSLSEKTENVLGGVDRDLTLVSFLSPGSEVYTPVDELLTRYQAANPARITKRVVDPARNLVEARRLVEQYDIDRENVVVVASGDDRRVIDEFDLAEYDYSGAQFGQAPTLEAFKGEQLITSAILELIEDTKPKILFTTGHGEAGPTPGAAASLSRARALLGEDNFELEEWASLGQGEVPADADLVVIAGPTSAFLEPELETFSRYLEAGGRMLLLLDPVLDPQSLAPDYGLGAWLAGYGVEIRPDLVIDPANTLPFFGAETLFTADYGFHPIVEALEQTRTPVLLPLARSVRAAEEPPEGMEVTELVESSSEGWAESDLEQLPEVDLGEADLAGPVALGVAVSFEVEAGGAESGDDGAGEGGAVDDEAGDAGEAETEDGETEDGETEADAAEQARLVVFGDLDFATDANLANGANANLLLNTLNWLVEREQLLAIEARRPEQTRLQLSGAELGSITWLVLVILPALGVAAGVMVYLRRRR